MPSCNIHHQHREQFGVRNERPGVNLHGLHFGVDSHVCPTEKEMTKAYNTGEIPFWVVWYGLTNVIVDEATARTNLIQKGLIRDVPYRVGRDEVGE